MRHLKIGRKLGVDQSHRIALLRSLTLALIEQPAIKTTPARAKELRWYADRVVTLAKRGDLAARRQIVKLLGSAQTKVPGENRVRNAIEKVYADLVPRFAGRQGGYTQMVRMPMRRAGDAAEICVIRYLPAAEEPKKGGKKKAAAAGKKEAAPAEGKKASKKSEPQDKPAKKKKDQDKE